MRGSSLTESLRCRRRTCLRDSGLVYTKSPPFMKGGELRVSMYKDRGAGDPILPRVFRPPTLGRNLSPPFSSFSPPFGQCGLKADARVIWRPVSTDLLVAGQRVKACSPRAPALGGPELRARREGGGGGRRSDACRRFVSQFPNSSQPPPCT